MGSSWPALARIVFQEQAIPPAKASLVGETVVLLTVMSHYCHRIDDHFSFSDYFEDDYYCKGHALIRSEPEIY